MGRKKRPPHHKCYEPSPEQIAADCLEIQRGWGKKKGRWRRIREAIRPQAWEVPVIETSPKTASALNVLRIGRHGV